MEIKVLNQNGSGDSKVSLPESIFGQDFNADLVHQLITTYVANGHQNTKAQKNRSAVRGGGRKPWKQKGTGRARAGTIRSPIWRGGGVAFAQKFKKKMYRSAMRSIWSKLAEENKIIAIKEINIDEPAKSSQVKKILSDIGVSKALVVLNKKDEQLNKASKNLKECNVLTVNSINPSMLINADKVVVTSETISSLTEVLS